MKVSKKEASNGVNGTKSLTSVAADKKSGVQIKTIKTVARLLGILSVPEKEALTVDEIGRKFYGRAGTEAHTHAKLTDAERRNIQRYAAALSTSTEAGPALIEVIESGAKDAKRKTRKFYHKRSDISKWLMSDEAALNLLLSQQVIGRAFGSLGRIGTKGNSEIAAKVASATTETQRLRERLRVVPDGIGRLAARIRHEILQETVEAIAKDRQLTIKYIDPNGKETTARISPQGLVAKDGTIYLISTTGLSDGVGRPYALHRMKSAKVHNLAAQTRPDFNLDHHIKESHQLSHPIDYDAPPLNLKLRVDPDALYHFDERPLSSEQVIGPKRRSDGWHIVTAMIPNTRLLVPFLLSMGGWIEVLEPQVVRAEMAKRVRAMAQHYAADPLG